MLEKQISVSDKQSQEYYDFVSKFETKKTTDDCYTPPKIYDVIIDYIDEHIIDLSDKKIVRPFYPNGDYQKDAQTYDENIIVIDNPPFSMTSQIRKFYTENNIKFFLFCSGLTAFSAYRSGFATTIITGVGIKYANGANVPTAFLTNLMGDTLVKGCPILAEKLKQAQASNKPATPKYEYPDNVLMASDIAGVVGKGISIEVDKKDAVFITQLDTQKPYKKNLFGYGFFSH